MRHIMVYLGLLAGIAGLGRAGWHGTVLGCVLILSAAIWQEYRGEDEP